MAFISRETCNKIVQISCALLFKCHTILRKRSQKFSRDCPLVHIRLLHGCFYTLYISCPRKFNLLLKFCPGPQIRCPPLFNGIFVSRIRHPPFPNFVSRLSHNSAAGLFQKQARQPPPLSYSICILNTPQEFVECTMHSVTSLLKGIK